MFTIKFFPARFGDSIRIAYGSTRAPKLVLIDGGTAGTREAIRSDLATFSKKRPTVELLVVTHIDRDHIEGILGLLEDGPLGFDIREIWFNGWPQLPGNRRDEEFGAVQGERLTAQIRRHRLPWNCAFRKGAAAIPDTGPLPVRTLPGGLRLTLLSPTTEALQRLKKKWKRVVTEAHLVPGAGVLLKDAEARDRGIEAFAAVERPDVAKLAASRYRDDRSVANCSSIAFLAEYGGKVALFAGDVPAGPLLAAFERFSPSAKVPLDLFKLSHHGSKNTTSLRLIEKAPCRRYVFSTNGASFNHPDPETVARVIAATDSGLELYFNYKTPRNKTWDERALRTKHGYRTQYPRAGENGIEIEL